jgi:uncharacterized protein (TIGR02231 family)
MRRVSALLITLVVAAEAGAVEVTAVSRVDAVTVFPAGAEVTRLAKVRLEPGEHAVVFPDLPAGAVQNSIHVEGRATERLEIGSVDSRRLSVPRLDPEAVATERRRLEDEIERLQDERGLLDGQIAAAEAQKKLIEQLTELPSRPPAPGPGGQAAREDWAQLLGLVATGMGQAQLTLVQTQTKTRELDRRIEDLKKKLAALAPAREERTEVKVLVSASAPLEAELAVRYQVPGASWSPLYDARLVTGSKSAPPKLELSRRASIMQRSGETWQDATVQLSTTRPGSGAAAPELSVATVDFEPERKIVAAPAPPAARSASEAESAAGLADEDRRLKAAPRQEAAERAAEVAQAPFQAVFAIPGRVTVAGTGEAKRVFLQQDAIEPALAVRTVPKADAKAFLYAKLALPKGSPLLPGPVSLFRDGTFVGTSRLPLLVAGEEHELGFGADDAVRVKHAIAEEKRGETGLISSSRTDQRNYKITVKNMHERAIPLTVIDQVPVALNQDIKVELTGRTAPTRRDLDDKRGVVAWETKLDPDEERLIEFGYRVTWPGGRNVVYGR